MEKGIEILKYYTDSEALEALTLLRDFNNEKDFNKATALYKKLQELAGRATKRYNTHSA